jgi:hypothetical protein
MSTRRKKINRILSRVMLGLGLAFLLYIVTLYGYYYFGGWH